MNSHTKLASHPSKRILVTFADLRFAKSLDRICRQAETLDIYDRILAYNERDIGNDLKNQLSGLVLPGVRGFGYWSWKPYFILRALHEADYGDIVHWVDAGCWLRREGRSKLLEYFKTAEAAPVGLVGFQAGNGERPLENNTMYSLPEWQWTKGDLLDYFCVRGNRSILDSNQIEATTFFVRKDPISMSIINKWMSVFFDHIELIDDSPSRTPNEPGFIENRHDQSVFSLLLKTHGATIISTYETYYPVVAPGMLPGQCSYDWSVLDESPIWAKRDLDRGLWGNLIYLFKKILARLLAKIHLKKYRRPW